MSEKGVLSPSCSRITLLIWHTIAAVSCTVREFKLVPLGRILLINLWLFSINDEIQKDSEEKTSLSSKNGAVFDKNIYRI